MTSNNMFSELVYKFTKIADLQPKDVKKSNFRFFDNFIKDDMVHKINPSRYRFYMQFMKALNDPDTLRKMIYENRLIQTSKEEEAEMINQITEKLNQLYALPSNIGKSVLGNDEVYTRYKNKLIRNENDVLLKKLKNMMKTYTTDKQNSKYKHDIIQAIEDTFKKHDHSIKEEKEAPQEQVGGDENDMKTKMELNKQAVEDAVNKEATEKHQYEDNATKIRDKFKNDSILHDYRDKLNMILETPTTNNRIKASKLNDILIDMDSNEFTSIKNVEVSKQDVLVFIGITFVIRMVSLILIDWSMNTNFIVSYTHAYYLYIALYSILLLIIVAVVNITYNYPYYKLFMDNHGIFSTMASSLYYMYIKPGYFLSNSFRFILHIGIILGITIPVVIIKEMEGGQNDDDDKLQYDYAKKKSIRKSLNNFTLIIWLFTSAIAFKVK